MTGEKKDMTDMKPIKRKGSLLERADDRFGFGGQLRKLEPGALSDGPVIEGRAAPRAPAPRRGRKADSAPIEAAAAPVAAVPATTAPVEGETRAITPAAAQNVAYARMEPAAPMQPVSRALLAQHGFISADGATGPLAEEYRLIKRQILRAAALPGGKKILIASAQPEEGKSFTAINLALSLVAEQGLSVILVDGDFARQTIPARLGLVPDKGLLDALADPNISLARCIIPTDIAGLAVLPAGTSSARDTELANSARMVELMAQLEAGAPDRIIIFDSMPLLAASSAGVLAQRCGQVLVVVRADVTREAALRDAIGLIGQHPNISLLLNRVRFTPEGRRFGSYYGEGG